MTKAQGANPACGGAKARLLRGAAVTVFLGLAGVGGDMVQPAFAQSYSFSQVTIEGNQRVDAPTVMGFTKIARGQAISAGQLNDAYQRLVNSGLFEEVSLVPQGSTLVIKLKEYPMVNIINFEGNKKLKDEALAEIASSKARRIYSPSQIEADAAAITEAYRAAGRIAVTVDPKVIRLPDNRVNVAFEIVEGKTVEIERLSFVGNRAFSDRRLRQVLESKQAGFLRQLIKADTFQPERLELDKQLLRDFYQSRGYVDAQILDASAEIARERDGFFLTFTVQEGRPFTIGNVSAVSEVEGVDAAEFEALLKLRPGITYSPALIENNITRLETLALKKGLTFVAVDPRITRNDREQTLDISFALVRGPKVFVERIDIQGNATTLDRVVRRQFRTVEGDPFNAREVRQSAERIRALGFFSDAKVDAQPGSSEDQVIVNVDVTEQPTGSLSFGLSYGVNSGPGVSVGFSESNFLGRGQTVGVDVSTGTDNINSSFTFVEPAFLGRDLKFKFLSYYNETDNQNADYGTRMIGIIPSIEFPLSESGRLELRFGVKSSKLLTVSTDSSTIIQDEAARGSLLSTIVGATYSYDSRITGLNPKGGTLLRFGLDYAGLGGDVESVSATALALAETKIMQEEVTVRAVFEGGIVHSLGTNSSRVTDRFFGNGKIRGFEPNGIGPRDQNALNKDALGGNVFAVARLEADFPLGLPEEYGISGGLFADVGSVWSLDKTTGTGGGLIDDSMNLRSSVGVSVFWTTPIGPLRFNFAKALQSESYDKEQVFDLTISTKF